MTKHTLGELALRARMAKRLRALPATALGDPLARMIAYRGMGGSDEIFRALDGEAARVEKLRREAVR